MPGELDTGTLEPGSADLRDTCQGRIVSDWMAHWLEDAETDFGPAVRSATEPTPRRPTRPTALLRWRRSGGRTGRPAATRWSRRRGSPCPAAERSYRPIARAAGLVDLRLERRHPRASTGEVVVDSVALPPVDAPAPPSPGRGHRSPRRSTSLDSRSWTSASTRRCSRPRRRPHRSAQLMVCATLVDVAPDGSRTLVEDLVPRPASRTSRPCASACPAWCTASPPGTGPAGAGGVRRDVHGRRAAGHGDRGRQPARPERAVAAGRSLGPGCRLEQEQRDDPLVRVWYRGVGREGLDLRCHHCARSSPSTSRTAMSCLLRPVLHLDVRVGEQVGVPGRDASARRPARRPRGSDPRAPRASPASCAACRSARRGSS